MAYETPKISELHECPSSSGQSLSAHLSASTFLSGGTVGLSLASDLTEQGKIQALEILGEEAGMET